MEYPLGGSIAPLRDQHGTKRGDLSALKRREPTCPLQLGSLGPFPDGDDGSQCGDGSRGFWNKKHLSYRLTPMTVTANSVRASYWNLVAHFTGGNRDQGGD